MSETEDHDEQPLAIPTEGADGGIDKVHVDELHVRDRVILQTAEGSYLLTVGKNSHCILSSDTPSKTIGQILLRGGTNADVTEYTPNRIFVGGRLAYAVDEGDSSLVTTPVIESLDYEPGLR
ncbi:MAG: hypothetical protein WCH98_20160 [Verrucomicrobiota bacterium]